MKNASRITPTDRAFTPPRHRVYRVTRRQNEALYWLSLGYSVSEVGANMDVTENTVRSLLRRLYARLGVHTAAEATRVGFETGLLTPRPERIGEVVATTRSWATTPVTLSSHGGQPAPQDLRVPGPDGPRDRHDEHGQAAGT